jgi:DNA-binding GntR family transcriptional regulator
VTRKRPAQEKASAYLHQLLGSGTVAAGQTLPNVKGLAKEVGVSHVAMLRALGELGRAGVVRVNPGARTVYLGGEGGALGGAVPQGKRRPETGWRRTAGQLRDDVLNGVFGADDPLPSAKELTFRYGVCNRTLRKALDSLVEQGYIVPQRKQYVVVQPRSRGPSNTVLFVFRARATGSLENMPPRSLELLRELERACALSELNLAHVPCDMAQGGAMGPSDDHLLDADDGALRDSVLGGVLWTIGFRPEHVRSLLLRLARFGKPIAVLDELSLPPSDFGAGRHLARVFSMATSELCGEQMGHHLLRQGHRHAAFVSIAPGVDWCEQRLAGLRRVFAGCEQAGPVRQVIPPRSELASLLPFRPEAVLARTMRRDFRAAMSKAMQVYHRSLQDAAGREMRKAKLWPLLRRLIEDREVTAWVGANDSVALSCLDFLRSLQVAVPQRISVLGFDDTLEASYEQLTSYNFNYHNLTRQMLSYVCGPVHRRESARHTQVEVEGFVNERMTTGVVAPAGS